MKHEHIEKPSELLRWKENTVFLLNDVIKWMEQNLDRVDLNQSNSFCGTYACVGGWYYMRRYGKKWTDGFNSFESAFNAITNEFGMSYCYAREVFGLTYMGTLAERKTRIKNHLSHLNTQIAQWYADRQVAVI